MLLSPGSQTCSAARHQDARTADHRFLTENDLRVSAVGCMGKTPQLGPVSFLRLPSPLLSGLLLLLLLPPLQAPVLIKEMEQK